jgi:hypothetical protein
MTTVSGVRADIVSRLEAFSKLSAWTIYNAKSTPVSDDQEPAIIVETPESAEPLPSGGWPEGPHILTVAIEIIRSGRNAAAIAPGLDLAVEYVIEALLEDQAWVDLYESVSDLRVSRRYDSESNRWRGSALLTFDLRWTDSHQYTPAPTSQTHAAYAAVVTAITAAGSFTHFPGHPDAAPRTDGTFTLRPLAQKRSRVRGTLRERDITLELSVVYEYTREGAEKALSDGDLLTSAIAQLAQQAAISLLGEDAIRASIVEEPGFLFWRTQFMIFYEG